MTGTETKTTVHSSTATRILRVIAFIVLTTLMIHLLSSILVGSKYISTWVGTISENPIYTVPKNSLEVVSLGSSWGMTSFSPLEIYNDYGISAYNYSSEQQAPIVSYYVLKEVIKRQKNLKIVLLNPYCLVTRWDYGLARKAFDRIPMSKDKIQGIQEMVKLKPDDDPLISYLMPLYKFHTRWKSLNRYDFMLDIPNVTNKVYKISNGYLIGFGNQDAGEFAGFTDNSGEESSPFTADGELYYTKIAQLCKEHNIVLILYSQPLNNDSKRYNAYKSFANAIDVPLIDFNTQSVAMAAGINWHTDIGGHQATGGGIKVSRYLGKYLHENYQLADVRGIPQYNYLDAQYSQYVSYLRVDMLLSTSEIDAYLTLLKNPYYSIFIAVKDEASLNFKDSSQKLLFDLGLRKQLKGHYRQAYLAVIESGEVITEQLTDSTNDSAKLEYNGELSNSLKYAIKSTGYQAGDQASIIIDGKEYSVNSRGINIVVYDNEQKKVIDKISFDTHADSRSRR